jgi:hypothetical protein
MSVSPCDLCMQGKIKGSYTAAKMVEFCRRGTLSARQGVLGIDRDLPYALRQVAVLRRVIHRNDWLILPSGRVHTLVPTMIRGVLRAAPSSTVRDAALVIRQTSKFDIQEASPYLSSKPAATPQTSVIVFLSHRPAPGPGLLPAAEPASTGGALRRKVRAADSAGRTEPHCLDASGAARRQGRRPRPCWLGRRGKQQHSGWRRSGTRTGLCRPGSGGSCRRREAAGRPAAALHAAGRS